MQKLGIIGFGSFGRFMAQHLRPHFELVVSDSRDLEGEAVELGASWASNLEVATCQTVVLAVPSPSLAAVVAEIRPSLQPGTLVVDVCSVKVQPLEVLEKQLPEHVELLGTHPMFGPQSGKDGIAGLRVVMCPIRTTHADRVCRFLEGELKLQVLEMTPQRHDAQMAYIQGLTHWMAKALREITLPDLELSTPAYRHLLQIEEILREDSDDLFLTIQRDNPFVAEARAELVEKLSEIESWIEDSG